MTDSGFSSNTPTLTEILTVAWDGWLNEVHTCMPGTVQAYHADDQTADVRLGFKRVYADGSVVEYPVVANVPIVLPATQAGWLRLPVATGDTVLVHFCERALANWWLKGGAQDPELPRKMSTADAVAVPGLLIKSSAMPVKGAADSVELATPHAWLEITQAGTVKITTALTGKLVLGNGTLELLSLMDDFMSAVSNLVTTNAVIGSPCTVSPATQGVIAAIRAQLGVLKQ